MGFQSGRRNRFAAVAGLLAALGLTAWLLLPGGLSSDRAFRRGEGRETGAERSVPSGKGEANKAAAAEPPETSEAPSEQIPYGDKSLPQDLCIRGRVTDREGKPVKEAVVEAAFKNWNSRPFAWVHAARVRTEEDGSFVLGPLERRDHAVLAQREEVGVALAAGQWPGSFVEMVLAPGASISGKVTARADGKPVAGATLLLLDNSFQVETRSDAEGRYRMPLLPPSPNLWAGTSLLAVAPGCKTAYRTQLMLRGGKAEEIDFLLEEGKTLTGKVIDAQSLKPIPGAVVGEGWEPHHRTTLTDAEGSFSLPDMDIAPNLIFTAKAKGYLPQERQSDGTGVVEFQLDASLRVFGRVLDFKDRPLAGAKVYLHRVQFAEGFQSAGQSSRGPGTTVTDADGAWRFEDVLPGKIAIIAFHKEWAPGESKPVDVPVGGPAPPRVDVTLRQGATIAGEVKDRLDKPLAGVQVRLYPNFTGKEGYSFATNYVWNESPFVYSDEKGRFAIAGALPGQMWLNGWHQSYGWTGTSVQAVEGQRVEGILLSFAGARISGLLLTADGDPVPGANVNANGPTSAPEERRQWRSTVTDNLGRFCLAGIEDGTYNLQAWSPMGQPPPLLGIPAGSENVEMRLKPAQTLSGEVTSLLSGRPIERFTLFLQPQQDGQDGPVRGDTWWNGELRAPDGRFDRRVSAGVYTVMVKAAGHAPQTIRDVLVEENYPPPRLSFRLEGGGTISGVLRDAEGKSLPNVNMQANPYFPPGSRPTDAQWMRAQNDLTDSRGRFILEGMAPGTYVLQANLGKRGAVSAQVTLQGFESVERDLQLLPTGSVLVLVVDEAGHPVSNVYVQFTEPENGNWLGWANPTGQDGRTTSQPMPMGPARGQTWHEENRYQPATFDVVVESGKTTQVRVVVKKTEAATPGEEGDSSAGSEEE